jgi:hypothetical protein
MSDRYAGQIIRSADNADFEARLDVIEAQSLDDWSVYGSGGSTVLSASTTPPTQGNSTYQFEYLRVHAKLWRVRFKVTVGSTFSAGSGTYRLIMPANMSAGSQTAACNSGAINDSGTALKTMTLMPGGTNWFEMLLDGSSGGAISSGGPGTAWGSADWFMGECAFEPA